MISVPQSSGHPPAGIPCAAERRFLESRPSAHGNPDWPGLVEVKPEVRDDPDGPGVLVPTSPRWPRTDPAFLAATATVKLDIDGDGRADLSFTVRTAVLDSNGNGVADRDGDSVSITVESARVLGILPLDVCAAVRRRVVSRVIESI